MKRILFLATLLLLVATTNGQNAKSVLDKTAAVVSNKNGVQANFKMVSNQYGTTEGTIAVKGRKFHATTPQATIWFDGKTQWTYMKKNDEVNVSNPTDAQLQALNPYNFIYMYKQGYSYTMTTKNNTHEVHLTTTDKKKSIQEMYITINSKTYIPSQIRMKQAKGWSTITLSGFKNTTLSDGIFRFNAKDFPSAEVIDLR